MFDERKLIVLLASREPHCSLFGWSRSPIASAETCMVTVTVVGGQTLTLHRQRRRPERRSSTESPASRPGRPP